MSFFEIVASAAGTLPVGGVILTVAAFGLTALGVILVNRNPVVGTVLYGYVGNGLMLYGIAWMMHPDQPFRTGVYDLPDIAYTLVAFLALVATVSMLWMLVAILVDEFGSDLFVPRLSGVTDEYVDTIAQGVLHNTPITVTDNAQKDATPASPRPWHNASGPYGRPAPVSDVEYFKGLRGLDDESGGERTTVMRAGGITGEQRQVRPLSRR